MFALYQSATGRLVSVGTVVADPLPVGLAAVDLGGDDRLVTGYGYWDEVSRSVLDVIPSPGVAAQVAAQLTADTAADLTKLRDAIDQLATLLGDNTTTGSIRSWRGGVTNQYSAGHQRALADLLIADGQATRRIARQVLRLAKAMVGDYSTADVGTE